MDTLRRVCGLLACASADDWAACGLVAWFFYVMVFVL